MAKKEEKAIKEKSKENKVKKHFFKDFKAELKKVIWPTPKQLINNTVAVVVIVVITGVIVFALDVAFEALNKYGITKLQSYVVEKFGEDEESDSDTTNKTDGATSEDNSSSEGESTESNNSTESNQ